MCLLLFAIKMTNKVENNTKHPVYLDCNATTPAESEVLKVAQTFLLEEFGNAGSRTHSYGARAKQAIQRAREQVAAVVQAKKDEVVFTSGATESNNIALLGLARQGEQEGRKHIITTAIEHKAVLEPMDRLEEMGFEVTRLPVGKNGWIDPSAVSKALRPDTFLLSVMQANNETGIIQPLDEIATVLEGHPTFFHTDAAQGFGKELVPLQNRRIDLISISGHKIYAPKGIGALIIRKRGYKRIPIQPLMVGGGQERGLRPGTLPVPLIAALGKAAEMALTNSEQRSVRCSELRQAALEGLQFLKPQIVGDQKKSLPHVLNLSIGNLDSEALMVATKHLVAISNGSACTSSSYSPSHVLMAMGMSEEEANCCVRISWCHMTPDVEWKKFSETIQSLV